MSSITLDGVSMRYGDVLALDRIDLDVADGELLALLGPSGCGKTTALRLMAGFLKPSAGRILFDNVDVSALPPHKRNIGMVFQDYALFPHLTVEDNVGFGLRERGICGEEATRRVAELLDLVKLPKAGQRYPNELSGGQQQRVALARAVAAKPIVLLMDEPFGALDQKLREIMQEEVVRIQEQLQITTIFVTHDQNEAMGMAHRIAVMSEGSIEQLASPEHLYHVPANRFVAEFVGKINLLEARALEVFDDLVVLDAGGVSITAQRTHWVERGMVVDVAVRPECIALMPLCTPEAQLRFGEKNTLEGTIAGRRFAGSVLHLSVETQRHGSLLVATRSDEPLGREATPVLLAWDPTKTVLLQRD